MDDAERLALEARIQDTLAYYSCRATSPKADHPLMGYHAFSEGQRDHLRGLQAEAAAEVVRIISAREVAEVERLREALHLGAELDNHHNAALCPYCTPGA